MATWSRAGSSPESKRAIVSSVLRPEPRTSTVGQVMAWLVQFGYIGFVENGIDDNLPAKVRNLYSNNDWIAVPGRPQEFVYNLTDQQLRDHFAK